MIGLLVVSRVLYFGFIKNTYKEDRYVYYLMFKLFFNKLLFFMRYSKINIYTNYYF